MRDRRLNGQRPQLPPFNSGVGWNPVNTGDIGEQDGLLNFWTIFWRRKLLLLTLSVVGGLVGFGVTLPKPIMYDARVVMESRQAQSVAGLGSAEDSGGTLDAVTRTQIEMLRSKSLHSAVLQRLQQEIQPSLPPVPPGFLYRLRRYVLDQILHREADNPVVATQIALSNCADTVNARGMIGTRVITISCESIHPQVAASFLNTLVKEFTAAELEDRRSTIEERTRWLSENMELLRNKAEKSEQKLQAFMRSGGVMTAKEPEALKFSRLQGMESQLSNLQADRMAKQALLESVQEAAPEAFVLMPEGAGLLPLFNRIVQARRQVAELERTLKPEHEKFQAAQQQVEDLEGEFRSQRELVLARLRRDVAGAELREKAQRAGYTRQMSGAYAVTPADKVIEQNILQRQVEMDRQLYNSFMANIQQANLLLAMPMSTPRLIDAAQVNLQPIQARTWTLNTVLGIFSGLMGGLLWVLMREKTSPRVVSPQDVSSLLQLPELGVIPTRGIEEPRRWLPRLGSKPARPAGEVQQSLGLSRAAGAADQPFAEMASLNQKPSFFAESFCGALASLTSGRPDARPQVILVTSPAPKEGKSIVASNLAVTLAETNHRVLLIDADLRWPRLHHALEVDNDWGLGDILQDSRGIDRIPLVELVKPTRIPNLSMITSGVQIANPGKLYCSQEYLKLMMRLRREFEYVIIDTPPVLQFADARFLGRMADGVILVLRSGATNRTEALSACQRLVGDGLVLLGTVLNDWRDSSTPYNYYYSSYDKKRPGRARA